MAILFRFAHNEYFLSGQFLSDLRLGVNPLLVDPKWEGTNLQKQLERNPLPENFKGAETNSFYLATSGSSGLPKLVHKNLALIESEVESWLHWPGLKDHFPGPAVSVRVPFCHLYGLIWGFFLPRALGKSIVFHDGSDTAITTAYSLQSDLRKSLPPAPVNIVSGMKFPTALSRKLRSDHPGAKVLEIYGSTETGAMAQRDPLRQNRFQSFTSVTFQTEPSVQDESEGLETELLVKSPFISEFCFSLDKTNIWRKENLKNMDGFFQTNDMGNLTENGWYHLGRKDRIVKIKGKRVSLDSVQSEIDSLDLEFPVLVFVYESENGDQIAIAAEKNQTNETNLLEKLRFVLPESHIPKKFLWVEKFPLLPNGKPDYKRLANI
ncbi:AMP-binding protein [Leptospira sp. 96542]|nr:AMP-binding protein [Leptospira sp. 96542]